MAYYISFFIISIILTLSVIALATIIERIFVFSQFKTFLKIIEKNLKDLGNLKEKVALINFDLKVDFDSVLESFQKESSLSDKAKDFRVEAFIESVEGFLSKRLIILQTGATVSPTLGILGTVTGMIAAFSGFTGGEVTHRAMFIAGILQALYSTAFGLTVSIVCMIAFNFLNRKIEDISESLNLSLRENLYKAHHD